MDWKLLAIVFLGAILRFILIIYAHWHDSFFDVKFTDIDYRVFSDGAKYMAAGKSPYRREAFRYTPILAWIMIPNINYPDFGKIVFCIADLFVGLLLYVMVVSRRRYASQNSALIAASLWILNPFTIIVSSRGNAESLLAGIILATLYCIERKYIVLAAVLHGFAVHFKLYPIIYLPCIAIYLNPKIRLHLMELKIHLALYAALCSLRIWLYCAVFAITFSGFFCLCYSWYGYEFFYQTYLYHFVRKDTAHNFSPYFYPLALLEGTRWEFIVGLSAFLPQVYAVLYAAVKFSHDQPFAWFLATFLFVAFNKVCTSQYFLWYLCLFPLIIPSLKLSGRDYAKMLAIWLLAQGIWLGFAYLLEFKKWSITPLVWLCSVNFLFENVSVARKFISVYKKKQ